MDRELQDYYESCFETFSTKGWKYLMEDFTKLKDTVQDLSTVLDAQSLFHRQGQLDILNLFLKRKEATEAAYKQLTEETE
jgi:hypothetical protein